MRMVAHSGLVDHFDAATQLPVTFFQDGGVLRDRDYVVGVAHHVQQRNAGARQGFKTIDRIAAVVGKLLFGQSVALQPVGEKPVCGRALAFALGPTVNITHGRVGVDARDLFGVRRRPIVDVQAATAHAFQGHLAGQPLPRGQFLVEGIPMRNGLGVTEHFDDIHICQMETAGQQGQVGLRFVAEESRPPNPRLALGGFLGRHQDRLASVAQEIVAIVTIPATLDAGKRAWIGSSRDQRRDRKRQKQHDATSAAVLSKSIHPGAPGNKGAAYMCMAVKRRSRH